MSRAKIVLSAAIIFLLCLAYLGEYTSATRSGFVRSWLAGYAGEGATLAQDPFFFRLSAAAIDRTRHRVRYDPAYVPIPYPNGDVPPDQGVCADVIVRAYRLVGIDLQKEVHEDMSRSFSRYPKMWRLTKPDANIDHRRVPNLMTFFSRKGTTLPLSSDPAAYHPGDIVAWELSNGLLHIGLVVEPLTDDRRRRLVVHNIGRGPRMEDALFVGKIIGHFRYKKGS
jgi:hypothetical protein